ncbi:MAG: hypothetical protein QNJ72_33840 [Pleurocapsa sp. MO_226.B13]|nr:hypothetical protein [Pleurocapsa sp. MO_226.B13]
MSSIDLSQKIIDQCLELDGLLKTIKKALEKDGQEINGFSDHYSDLIQVAIDHNWNNHDIASEISYEDYKLDRIRDLVNR